ncbi:hypothetical protein CFD26_101826 [Aspergillus turcosus]|uniref:Uncharacterized protein n=1 Tax=Aspergillus turcosus TaxID=1245748 RepID=A0A3R7FMC9_9EURO|nr:hypothetical protein CFD26_101826 [Aspergillus turcosus]
MYKDLHDLAIANTLAVWVVCPHKDMEIRVEKFLFPEKDYEKTLQVFDHKIMTRVQRRNQGQGGEGVHALDCWLVQDLGAQQHHILIHRRGLQTAPHPPLQGEDVHNDGSQLAKLHVHDGAQEHSEVQLHGHAVMPNVRELDMLRRENMHITNLTIEDIFEDGLTHINSITEASAVFVLTMRMNVLLLPSPEDYKPLYKYIDVPLL